MSNKYDIGIIGTGIAGSFAALRIAETSKKIKAITFDFGRPPAKRRKRQLEGFLGCLPAGDGRIYPSDINKLKDIVDGRKIRRVQDWVFKQFNEVHEARLVNDSTPNKTLQEKITTLGFDIQPNNYMQWKPESIHKLSRNMSATIEGSSVESIYDTEVFNILKKDGDFLVNTENGDFICKNIIIAVGRSGWRWANELYKKLDLITNDDYAYYGMRVEMSSQYLSGFNKSHCTLSKENLIVGPFCWSGSVIPEDHADLVVSAFRSNEDRWKTDKVSFSVIGKRKFENEGCYQTERLAKLAYILYNDRTDRERVKVLLKKQSQLAPLKEYDWLTDIVYELKDFIPNIVDRGYFHAPNILPMTGEINLKQNFQTDVDNMFVVGESANKMGILTAAMSGCVAVDQILR